MQDTQDMRCKTQDSRQETQDSRQETQDSRQETQDLWCKYGKEVEYYLNCVSISKSAH